MRFSEAKQGRVFVIRLEQGEVVHQELERFASEHGITAAALIMVGAADKGSRLVVGPEDGEARPVVPMLHVLEDVHEVVATGTIFPNQEGNPVLHMHLAGGRKDRGMVGCVRQGVRVWQVAEVILFELVGSSASRRSDPSTGFELLSP